MENKKSGKGLVICLTIFMLAFATCAALLFTGVVKSPLVKEKECKCTKCTDTKTDDNKNKNGSVTNKEYQVGDVITFNNESWHVIKASSTSDDYVVALKDESLADLNGKPYYTCPAEDDNGINCNMKMSNDYKDSTAKKYFDNTYIDSLGKSNLKEVDGYYVRLITLEELGTLGCDITGNVASMGSNRCDNAPEWLMTQGRYWTMSYSTEEPTMDASKANVYVFGKSEGTDLSASGVGSTLSVRPVANILKSSLK